MKKFMLIVVSVFMALTSFLAGGCSGSSDAINVLLLVNSEQDAFYKEYFADLAEELDVKINYQGYAYQDYNIQLKTAMQDVPPDIFYITPGEVKMYAKDGILADFTEYLESDDFLSLVDVDALYSHALDVYRYDGETVSVDDVSAPIYGINQGFSYQGLGYNKTLVNKKAAEIKAAGLCLPWELGVGSNNPTYTFEEFALLLSVVKAETGGGLNGTSRIAGMNLPQDIMPMVWAKGGDILNGDTVTINNEAFAFVMNWIKTNVDAGNISKSATWGEWSVNEVAFFTEIGSWEVSGYVETNFDFDMMPWPTVNGDNNWYGQIGTAAYAVYSGSPRKELAMQIAAGFLQERVQETLVKEGLALPMYVDTAENAYLTDDETYKPEHRSIFIDVISMQNGKYSPVNNTFNSEWYDEFMADCYDFVNTSQSVSAFLQAQQTRTQQLYDLQKQRES